MDDISFAAFLKGAEQLNPKQFKQFVLTYAKAMGQNGKQVWEKSVYCELEGHLIDIGVNKTCPFCGCEMINHDGYSKAGIESLECTACGKHFTHFTGTMLERSRYPWVVWVKILCDMLNDIPIADSKSHLEADFACEGINIKTVFNMRHNLLHAMARVPQPKLSGVIQIDETSIRESQKGKVELTSYVPGEQREPRYGRQPSKHGQLGPEFATVMAGVDNEGRCACAVTGLGRAPEDAAVDFYEQHCENIEYICTDGNYIYAAGCDLLDLPHYIKPSEYNTIIKNSGYIFSDSAKSKDAIQKHNRTILERLYMDGQIDYIEHREDLGYAEFIRLKRLHHLNLGRVNELHKDISNLIETKMTNVSTKYLPDYIGFIVFCKNWAVEYGHAPVSMADAEMILRFLLPTKIRLMPAELANLKLDLPKPSGRAMQILAEKTTRAREITKNKYFKFRPDELPSFNKRQILLDAPHSRLLEIGKKHKIERYTKLTHWGLASAIAKLPAAEGIIIELLIKNRTYMLDDEDIKYLTSQRYAKIKAP